MRDRAAIATALGVMLLTVGCGHIKEFAPIRYSSIYPRIPNQQRLISQPAREATEKACQALNLGQYAGKTLRVEVNGVFPHSEEDLLGFIGTVIEGEAARVGIKVLPQPDPRFAPDHVMIAHSGPGRPSLPAPGPIADVRLVASVDWGGIDLKDQQYVKSWPLAGQAALGGVSFIAGLASSIAVAADGRSGNLALTIPIPLLGVGAAIVWAVLDPSEGHIFTMKGKVRVTVVAMPQTVGLAAAAASAEGESSVVVDPESTTGYSLVMKLPKEASEAHRRQAQ